MKELLIYVVIGGVFLAGMVPLIAGIIHYVNENKALDKKKARSSKGVSIQH